MSHTKSLTMKTEIRIRLHSIEFLSASKATVTFNLFSHPIGNGGDEQLLCQLSQTTERVRRDRGGTDYDRTVSTAADKLKQDFERVVGILSNISSTP